MYVNKIEPETNIRITVSAEGKNSVIVETKAIQGIEQDIKGFKGVYVEPLFYKGKRLKFENVKCEAEIVNSQDDRTYIFKEVSLYSVGFVGRQVLCMVSRLDARPLNRREAVRLELTEQATLQIGKGSKAVEGITHDISVGGISFKIADDVQFVVGDKFSASFDYSPTGRTCKVYGEIVRSAELPKNTVLIGCKLTEYSSNLKTIIADLMRKDCRTKKVMR